MPGIRSWLRVPPGGNERTAERSGGGTVADDAVETLAVAIAHLLLFCLALLYLIGVLEAEAEQPVDVPADGSDDE